MKRLLLLTALFLGGCASAGFGNLDDIIANTPILVTKNVTTNADEIFYCVENKMLGTAQKFQRSISPDKTEGRLTTRVSWIDSIWILKDGILNVRATDNQWGNWKKRVEKIANECAD
jgi:hypothetical protein